MHKNVILAKAASVVALEILVAQELAAAPRRSSTSEQESTEETETFFTQSFEKVGVEVEKEALYVLSYYSGGHPALAHEIGDATFKVDEDNIISQNDAVVGVINAAEVVGRKYIEPQVYEAIKSDRYKSILNTLLKDPGPESFRRRDILRSLEPDEEKVLDNFLKKMTDLGVFVKDPDHGRGAYKFAQELHFVYFWLRAKSQD